MSDKFFRFRLLIISILIFMYAPSARALDPSYKLEVILRLGGTIPGGTVNSFSSLRAASGGVIAFLTSFTNNTESIVRYDPSKPAGQQFEVIATAAGFGDQAWDLTDNGDVYFINRGATISVCSIDKAARGVAAVTLASTCEVEIPYPLDNAPDASLLVKRPLGVGVVVAGGVPYFIAEMQIRGSPQGNYSPTDNALLKIEGGAVKLAGGADSFTMDEFGVLWGGENGKLYTKFGNGGISLPLELTNPGKHPRTLIGNAAGGQIDELDPEFNLAQAGQLGDFSIGSGRILLCPGTPIVFDGANFLPVSIAAEQPQQSLICDADSAHAIVSAESSNGEIPLLRVFSATPGAPEFLFRSGQFARYGDTSVRLTLHQPGIEIASPQTFDSNFALTGRFDFSDGEGVALARASLGSTTCSIDVLPVPPETLNGSQESLIHDAQRKKIKKALKRAKNLLTSAKPKRAKVLREIIKYLKAELRDHPIFDAALHSSELRTLANELSGDAQELYAKQALCSELDKFKEEVTYFRQSRGLKPGEFVDGIDDLKAVLAGEETKDSPKTDKVLRLFMKGLVNSTFGGEAKDLSSEALKLYDIFQKNLKKGKEAVDIGKEVENGAKTIFKSVGKARFGKELAGAVGEVGRGAVAIAEVILHRDDPKTQFSVIKQYVETIAEKAFIDIAKDVPAAYAALIGYSLAAPIGDSIARDLNQVIDAVLADACLRVLEKAQHNPLPFGTSYEDPAGDRPDGSIGSFTCAFPRTAQIVGDTLPSGVLKDTTCVLSPGAVIPAAPTHCLIEVQPPDTFWSGFWDYFGQGPKKRYFDAAFVSRRSLK